jgi:glycosyltransferase involved in cell wall biosynthesis
VKILLQSYWFWPSVGGIETVSQVLAEGWCNAGHTVTVVTNTPAKQERNTSYAVVRRPTWHKAFELVRDHDLVYVNGSLTHLYPLAFCLSKPFVLTHQDYSLQWRKSSSWFIDRPNESDGISGSSWSDLRRPFQVFARWLVAQLASANVAITHHMDQFQPLPRQCVIYNPIDYDCFAVGSLELAEEELSQSQATFSFIGRLCKEKGIDDLLHAFALVNQKRERDGRPPETLRIVGDGPDRPYLTKLCKDLKIEHLTEWTGFKCGKELQEIVRAGGIFIIPSRWEEPMGVVALELMAAGKPLIVSLRGGLSECAGDACLTFPNGDPLALAECMETLSEDIPLQKDLIGRALDRVKRFRTNESISAYLNLFNNLVNHG